MATKNADTQAAGAASDTEKAPAADTAKVPVADTAKAPVADTQAARRAREAADALANQRPVAHQPFSSFGVSYKPGDVIDIESWKTDRKTAADALANRIANRDVGFGPPPTGD